MHFPVNAQPVTESELKSLRMFICTYITAMYAHIDTYVGVSAYILVFILCMYLVDL